MTLVHLAEAGDVDGVLRELAALTSDERAAQAEALEARRVPRRAGWYRVPAEERDAQLAAELGCRTGPVAAADWILKTENGANSFFACGAWMLDVVNLHPVAWRAELAAQLADRSTPGMNVRSDLVGHLVHDRSMRHCSTYAPGVCPRADRKCLDSFARETLVAAARVSVVQGVPVGRGHMPGRRARPDHASRPARSRTAPPGGGPARRVRTGRAEGRRCC